MGTAVSGTACAWVRVPAAQLWPVLLWGVSIVARTSGIRREIRDPDFVMKLLSFKW